MLVPSIFRPATTGWQNSRYYPVKVVGKEGNWILMPSRPRRLYWGEGGRTPASAKQLVYFAADCFSRCTCREHGHKDRVHGNNCREKVKQREHLTRRNMCCCCCFLMNPATCLRETRLWVMLPCRVLSPIFGLSLFPSIALYPPSLLITLLLCTPMCVCACGCSMLGIHIIDYNYHFWGFSVSIFVDLVKYSVLTLCWWDTVLWKWLSLLLIIIDSSGWGKSVW